VIAGTVWKLVPLLLGLIGVLLSLAFRLVDRRILTWYHGERDARR